MLSISLPECVTTKQLIKSLFAFYSQESCYEIVISDNDLMNESNQNIFLGFFQGQNYCRSLLSIKKKEEEINDLSELLLTWCRTKCFFPVRFVVSIPETISPSNWWCCPIVINEKEEFGGFEFHNGIELFPEWKQLRQLQLVRLISLNDFFHSFTLFLENDTKRKRSLVTCLDDMIYFETKNLLSRIQLDNLVLFIKGKTTSAIIFHDNKENGRFWAEEISNGERITTLF